MGRQRVVPALAALAAVSLVVPTAGLYFFVTEGQQRCFIEEVPADTLIVGKYKNPDFVPFGQANFNGVVRHRARAGEREGLQRLCVRVPPRHEHAIPHVHRAGHQDHHPGPRGHHRQHQGR
jgi:hypothetical protein